MARGYFAYLKNYKRTQKEALRVAQQMQSSNVTRPIDTSAQAKNAQNASMLNVLRGQAANVDLLA